jgi:hypothetical protein
LQVAVVVAVMNQAEHQVEVVELAVIELVHFL